MRLGVLASVELIALGDVKYVAIASLLMS